MFLQSLTACRTQSVDSSSFTSDFVARMSSEEVAELAQAIHSHADALYESWTKGPDVMRRMEDTLELLADPGLTPKLEHLVSTFVRRDKAKRQQFRQQNSPPKTVDSTDNAREQPLNGSSPPGSATSKKPLPKSILAVVQRFEPSPERTNKERAASPANDLVKVALPGLGIVNKNVLWAESSSRHQVTEKNLARQTSPVPSKTFLGAHQSYNSNNSSSNGGTRVARERHIPIERCDRDDSPSPAPVSSPEKNSHAHSNRNSIQQSTEKAKSHVDYGGANIDELEREEEKLFRALRTGQVVPAGQTSDPNSLDLLREKATSPSNSNSSRVAFAKERIRQSQEHPLTQQRLELQKRLPSPSSSLAAAIAMQQGKTKFQPNHHSNGTHSLNGSPVDDEVGANKENSGGSPANTTNGYGGGGGGNGARQGWVTTVLRFGPGSSVADRVQLFEKYPAHIVNSTANSSYVPVVVSVPNSTTSPSPPKEANIHWSRKHTTHSPTSNGTNNTSTNVSGNVSAPWRIPVATETQHQADIVLGPAPKQPKGTPKTHLSSTPIHRTSLDVPRFYYPEGSNAPTSVVQHSINKAEEYIKTCSGSINFSQFGSMLIAIGIPLYWKKPFWKVFGLKPTDTLSAKSFIPFYESLLRDCPDDAARFIRILSTAGKFSDDNIANITNNNRHSSAYENYGKLPWDLRTAEASMSDFTAMIQDIIDTHPGLGFLRDAPEFHSRYITTVISRIFYKINRSWTGRMTLSELRRSNLLRVIKRLQEETDVNNIKEYFSYEHFYVIYCKFWELDTDHDLLIDKNDLAAHSERSLSSRIIDRIFSGTVLRGWEASSPVKCGPGKMTYSDFVWFLLSEEDKKTPTAIEYWFRCLDMDGDGILSPYEIEYFYTEQANRIEALNIEPLDFKNIYCQIADMLHCSTTAIRLRDLKKNPSLAATIFNTLFNLEKYLDHEQRDPFATAASASGSHDSIEGETDWDKYAAAEYEFLIAEENPNDAYHGSDFEDSSGLQSP